MTARFELPPHQPRPETAKLALSGVRVIDFTHFIAGPVCTLILADFGAEVIKIENAARGDDMRAMRTFQLAGEGGPFLWANRNKQSVGLDLSLPEGREIARRLITEADIVVENFGPGVMQKRGLDYDSLKPINPRLIMASLSAFGRKSPLAHKTGYDMIAQAFSHNRFPLPNSQFSFSQPIALCNRHLSLGAFICLSSRFGRRAAHGKNSGCNPGHIKPPVFR